MPRFLKILFFKISVFFWQIKLSFQKPNYEAKVFCIGFMKTGTTSLGKSLEQLGYRNSTFNYTVYRDYYLNGKLDQVLDYTARFDSFDDVPWSKEAFIPILDEKFPNSKFIYLERDEESWKKSLINWSYNITKKPVDVEKYLNNFRNHKTFILDYFKNRPANEFIILNIQDKDGFKKLADFLGKETNQAVFPHYNKTKTTS